MKLRPWYFTRQALEAMRRGPYVALVGTGTIFVALFATGLLAGVLGGAERLLQAWAGEVRISVYLAPGTDLAKAQAAVAAVVPAAPGYEVRAVPAAAALRQLSEEIGDDAHVLDGVGPGVVQDAVELRAPGISLDAARALEARLRVIPGVADVDYGKIFVEKIEAIVARSRSVALVLFAALALATAVLVGNTLRLAVFARREEIEILKLVGATDAFVSTPFLIEGLLQGLLGAAFAILALLGAHALLLPRLRESVPLVVALRRADLLPPELLLGLLAGGAAVGLLGSALAVVRTLRRS